MKTFILTLSTVLMLAGCGCPKQGPKGDAGATGAAGQNGADGQNGTNGTNGINGTSCSVTTVASNVNAPNGGSLISCSDGTSSLVLNGTNGTNGVNGSNGANGTNGNNGTDGTNGTNGTNGINGTNGTNGTVISAVQLCPGVTVYPSKFIEVAFCMNDKLYAVYSANGGFLTETPPGTYGSQGINSSCNFVIGAHCTVQ